MKIKKFKNPFIFRLFVGTCCKNLMTLMFLKTYQIRVFFSQKSYVCDKNFKNYAQMKKIAPKK
jgi:hypothetical protein